MLINLGKGLLARLLAYGVFGLGFWLLFQAFSRPSVLLGVLGGVMVPVGMYLMVTARRASTLPNDVGPAETAETKEEDPLDSVSGRR